jgi:LPXTG-site transpeptidase (sortase) family protein
VPRARVVNQLAGSMTTVIAVMLLVFVAEMAVVGPVRHLRAQHVLYQQFRSQMADAVAPTGYLGADGRPVPIGDPVALMAIPEVGLKEVVVQGTTSGVLTVGPGHRRDTPLPGQAGTVVIFGRQATYGGPFRRIASLKAGDEIAFATGQGNALYEVTGIRHAGDPAPVPAADAARLTLITGAGTPYLASEVVRVDAELKSPVQPSSRAPVTAASLAPSEAAMANDRSALVQLLLWSQLLLVLAVALAWVRAAWGRWQSWIVSVPVIGVVGFKVAALLALLLPNLL